MKTFSSWQKLTGENYNIALSMIIKSRKRYRMKSREPMEKKH